MTSKKNAPTIRTNLTLSTSPRPARSYLLIGEVVPKSYEERLGEVVGTLRRHRAQSWVTLGEALAAMRPGSLVAEWLAPRGALQWTQARQDDDVLEIRAWNGKEWVVCDDDPLQLADYRCACRLVANRDCDASPEKRPQWMPFAGDVVPSVHTPGVSPT